MWEYKIYKTNLGFGIYRKKTVGKLLIVEFLQSKDKWGLQKSTARTFYTKDEAISAMVIMKSKGDNPIEEPVEEEKIEKKTRSEL